MKLSEHLHAAADGFDEQAAYARQQGDAEGAAQSDRLAAHMRRLAGNHECAAIWDGDAAANPQQLDENAALVSVVHPIRAVRQALGLSQEAFAQAINAAVPGAGVTRFAVSRWESSRVTPSPAMADAIRRLTHR